MSAGAGPLRVETLDGAVWVRAAVTRAGLGLYCPEGVTACPRFVMATLAELAEHGVKVAEPVTDLPSAVALMGALPMPVGTVAEEPTESVPVVVRRFDIAMEPAPEEEQVLTIGCIAEDGRPVALLLDLDDRPKVARWLALDEGTSMHDSVTGANLARWEEEQENARLRLALKAAQRGRRQLRARVAELEAQAKPRGRERLAAKSVAEAEATHWKRLGVAPPEDPHDGPLHHSYAVGRDLPEVTPTEAAARAAVDRSVKSQFPVIAAFLAEDPRPEPGGAS